MSKQTRRIKRRIRRLVNKELNRCNLETLEKVCDLNNRLFWFANKEHKNNEDD